MNIFGFFRRFVHILGGKVINLAEFFGLERRVLVFFHQNNNWLSCKRKPSSVVGISVMLHAKRPQGRFRAQGVIAPPPYFSKSAKFDFFVFIKPLKVEQNHKNSVS